MLAAELALAGVDVAIVEKRLNQDVEGSRASGLHPRSLELLDQRGVAERFIAQGSKHHAVMFAGVALDASDRPTRHSYSLGLWQARIERALADWVAELRVVTLYRGREVTGFSQHDTGVDVHLDEGGPLRAGYLVGCDGGRSRVRKVAGIAFPGREPEISYLIFEADMADEPAMGFHRGLKGTSALGRIETGQVRGVVIEERLETGSAPGIDALRAALTAAYGTDFGVHDVRWLSRFTDAARQAAAYRQGRVLLAGDAAHVHSPVGGQGLNIGLQDAVNLGWKLAQVVRGISSDALLDTYQAERHPVGAALLQQTLALTALGRGDDRSNALRALTAQAMQMDEPRRWYAAQVSGLDVRYALGEGHPLLGRRMPDLDLVVDGAPMRLFELMHDAHPLLLGLDGRPLPEPAAAVPHLKRVDARFSGTLELPVIGVVATPTAVLVRPDGHVAWVAEGEDPAGLSTALEAWCGLQPSTAR